MSDLTSFIRATVDAGRCLLSAPDDEPTKGSRQASTKLLVPIRSLGDNHRSRIAMHLLSLNEQDRYLRFGYAAQDLQIEKYVGQLDFERDEIFGIYNRRLQLIAVAHLAMSLCEETARCAEFGVSVLASARGRGLGARLFERAALSASNAGVELMFIHALSENAAMLSIARKAGARVERDGSESEAYLKLQTPSFDTHMAEIIGEQVAQFDYQVKLQAKQFWDFLSELQAVRRATKDDQRIDGS
ncbi:GNAT family N-acetyltransferase [Janthinobacterium sp.]|uniref:GNAT family N-acetyltransferase n=1 Tax=Janthinobacterium sp. TaxID=1871054 RepID=UPI00293D6304|nr:GNAT family N-acetyltransferase [Janthinobacterium sp.]